MAAESKVRTTMNPGEVMGVSSIGALVGASVYAPFLNYATDTRFFSGYITRTARYVPYMTLTFMFKEKTRDMFFGEIDKKEGFSQRFGKSFLAGGEAGFLTNCLMYSYDNARLRLKADLAAEKLGGTRQFVDVQDAWKKTMSAEGVKGLYKGFIVSSIGIYAYRGLFFGLYDGLKPVMFGEDEMYAGNLGLGYITTIMADLAVRPLYTLYTQPILSLRGEEPYKGAMDCFSRIVKMDGYQGLFKGGSGCVVRGVFGALCLATYDRLKINYTDWRAGKPVQVFTWF